MSWGWKKWLFCQVRKFVRDGGGGGGCWGRVVFYGYKDQPGLINTSVSSCHTADEINDGIHDYRNMIDDDRQ